MEFQKIFVLGAGAMGNGIAQVCAQSNMTVVLCDISKEFLGKAVEKIAWSVSKLVEKGKVTESIDTVMGRIQTTTEYDRAADADIVIEAVYESVAVKHDVFKKLDDIIGEKTILASNTSAIPITEIAAVVKQPENFLGLHFFNPVPMMQAVEVIRGINTSDATFKNGADFVRLIGKEPIMVNRDCAGFILNRVSMVSTIEAMRLVEMGIASPEDIDKGTRLALGRRMGPFETNDLTGLDVTLMAYNNVYEAEKDIRFYPPSILKRKVMAGHLGKKVGKGWYEYNEDGSRKT